MTPSSAAGTNVCSEGPEMNTQTAKVEIDPETEDFGRPAGIFGIGGSCLVFGVWWYQIACSFQVDHFRLSSSHAPRIVAYQL